MAKFREGSAMIEALLHWKHYADISDANYVTARYYLPGSCRGR